MKDFIKSKECFASFVVAVVPSIGFWLFKPTDKIPYSYFVVVVLIAFVFLWLFLMTFLAKKEQYEPEIIRIIEVRDNIYICHPNKLLSQDVFVSFYLLTNKFEKLIGYGYVSNVQTNGIIQITPKEFCAGFSLNDLLSQNTTAIIIKPTVTINYLTQKLNEKEHIPNERT